MGLEFKTVTKIAEEGVEEATTSETSKELSLSVRFGRLSKITTSNLF